LVDPLSLGPTATDMESDSGGPLVTAREP
jgi:hypothetical protein